MVQCMQSFIDVIAYTFVFLLRNAYDSLHIITLVNKVDCSDQFSCRYFAKGSYPPTQIFGHVLSYTLLHTQTF